MEKHIYIRARLLPETNESTCMSELGIFFVDEKFYSILRWRSFCQEFSTESEVEVYQGSIITKANGNPNRMERKGIME